MTDLLPIWQADINAIAQTEVALAAAKVKETQLLTAMVNVWNISNPTSRATTEFATKYAAAFTAFVLQYNVRTGLQAQLIPQLSKLSSDMAPVLATLTDAQKQTLLANRAQYMANAYLLIVNLCLQYSQADALLEAGYIYNALIADINAAWANKNGTAPKPTPIASVIFDASNALNLYVGPNVPPSIGGPAPFVPGPQVRLTPHQFRVLAIESRGRLGGGEAADRAHLQEMLTLDLDPALRARVQFALSRHDLARRSREHEAMRRTKMN